MKDFIETPKSERKNTILPEEYNYFGRLIGNQRIHYVEGDDGRAIQDEWHLSWTLGGMAIQDVIILPDYEYGTSPHIFNPDTRAQDVAYGYTEKIVQLVARKQGEIIVLVFTSDKKRKWVFVEINGNQSRWQDIMAKDDGEWQISAEIYVEQKSEFMEV